MSRVRDMVITDVMWEGSWQVQKSNWQADFLVSLHQRVTLFYPRSYRMLPVGVGFCDGCPFSVC